MELFLFVTDKPGLARYLFVLLDAGKAGGGQVQQERSAKLLFSFLLWNEENVDYSFGWNGLFLWASWAKEVTVVSG